MVVDIQMSCRAVLTGMVSVAEFLLSEREDEPRERHNVQDHTFDLHYKAVDDHWMVNHRHSRLVQVLLEYRVQGLMIW